MTLNDFLAKAGDLFKSTEAQGDMVPKSEHEKAQAKIVEQQGEIAKLQTDLAASRAETEKAKAEGDKAKADAKAQIDAKEADVENRASAKAAQITAAQGQPPLTNTPKENATNTDEKKSELKGYARVSAAFQKQADQVMGRKL